MYREQQVKEVDQEIERRKRIESPQEVPIVQT
jgi:hypothetical protein